ncbi:MAG: alanine--tRNA ligase-related protein, partial [Alphaproteobacteria bacterium]
ISGLPDSRILRLPTSDNFWSMGNTGPCGPCSEIFYDHGDAIAGGPPGSPDQDGDRFMEIWNLVFMQFEQVDGQTRIDLPRPSVDTGMGLERMANVMQGKHNNYDTDLFRPLIEAAADFAAVDPDGAKVASLRAIADHARASSFLIADGVLPSNEGRGYVLRRIMRRAMRHAHMLGARDPLLWRLVPVLEGLMGQAYPELTRAQGLIEATLRGEENRFREMLERGLRLLTEETGRLAGDAPLPGNVAFRLYDTFGFPLDLTQDVLRAEGREVDVAGFDSAMERQRADARRAWSGSGDAAAERIWFTVRERAGASEFLGYNATAGEGLAQAIVRDGVEHDRAAAGDQVAIVCNQSPFYGESGGQMGDTGTIVASAGNSHQADLRIHVTDTQKRAGELIVHMATLESGVL